MVNAVLNIEHEFVCAAIPIQLDGMKVGLMRQFIVLCGPSYGRSPKPHMYGVTNPFPWMTLISLLTQKGKTKFFEKCAKSGVGFHSPLPPLLIDCQSLSLSLFSRCFASLRFRFLAP
jgi:hypothetical protein